MQPSKATELAKRLADRARALKQLRVWRVLGWIFGSIAGALMAGLLLFGIALAVAFPNLPDISGLTDYRHSCPAGVVNFSRRRAAARVREERHPVRCHARILR